MTVYIDPPTWPGHGRLWSHLISDLSYDELHRFAAGLGVPSRAFERDHYDVRPTATRTPCAPGQWRSAAARGGAAAARGGAAPAKHAGG